MRVFHLSEPKHGWIDVTFGVAPVTSTLTVSDVSNECLRDFAAATARLLRHSTREMVQFPLEPAFASCELHREIDLVRAVVRHPDRRDPVFASTVPLRAFARGV